MNTHHVTHTQFGWKQSFPYFTTPRWQQGKRRAYFKFLVPYPRGSAKMRQFVDSLMKNSTEEEISGNQVVRDSSYAVTVRESPPDRGGNILYSKGHRLAPGDCPLEVGAQSALKPLLPFMSDEVLRKGYGIQINGLSTYVRGFHPEKAPLLRYAPTGLVRVEAYHYGACELDAFVFGLAQKAGMEVQWPEERCREAALMQLEQCGLPIDGLASSGAFAPERYM